MIIYDPAKPSLAREFIGSAAVLTMLPGAQQERPYQVGDQLRAMVTSLAWELEQRYGLDYVLTHILRTWGKQDELYPEQAEKLGAGAMVGKKLSPHQLARGVDGYAFGEGLAPGSALYEEGMAWAEKWVDDTFPYGWNNPKRGSTQHTSAYRHRHVVKGKSKGDHLHIGMSW